MASKRTLPPPFDVPPVAPHDTMWDCEMRSRRARYDRDGLELMLSDAKQGRTNASTGLLKLEFERRIMALQQAIGLLPPKGNAGR